MGSGTSESRIKSLTTPVEPGEKRSTTASDGSGMPDNPAISAVSATDQQKRSRQAAERVLKRQLATAAVTDASNTLGVIVSTSAARRRTCGSQSGRRPVPLGPARYNGPQSSAALGVHQRRAERQGRSSSAASARSSGPNCASEHSVPPGSNRLHRRSGSGYRFRAARRAGRGARNRGNTRRPRQKQARAADEPGEHRFQHRPAAV